MTQMAPVRKGYYSLAPPAAGTVLVLSEPLNNYSFTRLNQLCRGTARNKTTAVCYVSRALLKNNQSGHIKVERDHLMITAI